MTQMAPNPYGAPLGDREPLREMNLGMWGSLSAAQRERTFTHPEFGTLNVWWIAAQMAGHDVHHYQQLTSITGEGGV